MKISAFPGKMVKQPVEFRLIENKALTSSMGGGGTIYLEQSILANLLKMEKKVGNLNRQADPVDLLTLANLAKNFTLSKVATTVVKNKWRSYAADIASIRFY